MKKLKFNKLFIITTMLMILMCISSISYAAEITLDGNKGTEENPIKISLSDYQTVVKYSGTKLPFYFEIEESAGAWIGLFNVSLDEEKCQVVFTLQATRSDIGSEGNCFYSTAGDRTSGYSYYQAGAILDDGSILQYVGYPVYKIKEIQCYDTGGEKEIFIGNGSANLQEGINTQNYVFASVGSGKTRSQLMKNSSGQNKNHVDDPHYTSDGTSILPADYANSIFYVFYGVSSEVLDDNETNGVEEIITKIGLAIGDAFLAIVRKIGGGWLSIDTLIFNQYKPTIIDFFGGSSGMYTGTMKSVINYWFGVFSQFARVILMMVLPVLGIRAMMFAGTPKQKNFTNLLSGWVIAVLWLFFGPYLMKYIIQINDALVAEIRKQSKYSVASVYNYDFLDQYQLGEDSTTTMLEKLNKVHSIVSEEAEKQYEELESKKEAAEVKLSESKDNFNNSVAGEALFQDLKEKLQNRGAPYKQYTDDEIRTMMACTNIFQIEINGTTTKASANTLLSLAGNYASASGVSPDEVKVYYNTDIFSKNTTSLPPYSGLVNSNLVKIEAKEVTEVTQDYLTNKQEYDETLNLLAELEKAIQIEQKGLDLMGIMREKAGQTYRFIYLLIWFLLIYQLIAMLFLYYKRLITLAALIAIYPLTIMMYGVEKAMGVSKPVALKTWITEYLVNVFIQSVHALAYLTLVEGGLSIYENDPDNWLIFVFAVSALIPLEGIIKSIIGFKATTLVALGASANDIKGKALAATQATKIATTASKDKGKDIDKKATAKESRITQKQKRHDLNSARRRMNRAEFAQKHKSFSGVVSAIDKASDGKKKLKSWKRNIGSQARKYSTTAKKIGRKVKDAAAISGIISTGIAGGGTATDFNNGVSFAQAIATKKSKDDDKSQAKAKKTAQRGGANTSSNRAAQNAKKATNNAANTTQTSGGANAASKPSNSQSDGAQPSNTNTNAPANNNAAQDSYSTPQGVENHQKLTNAFGAGLSQRNATNVNTNDNYSYRVDEKK